MLIHRILVVDFGNEQSCKFLSKKILQEIENGKMALFMAHENNAIVKRIMTAAPGSNVESLREIGDLVIKDIPRTEISQSLQVTNTHLIIQDVLSKVQNPHSKRLVVFRTVSCEDMVSNGEIAKFEESFEGNFKVSCELVCCYDRQLSQRLGLIEFLKILKLHDLPGKLFNQFEMADLIQESFTSILGAETTLLVVKSLKLVYKLDWSNFALEPERFANTLRKLLGDEACSRILAIASSDFSQRMCQKTMKL